MFCILTSGSRFGLNCWLLLIENNESNDFNHRVELVETVSDVFLGQIFGHIINEQSECFLRATRDGDLESLINPQIYKPSLSCNSLTFL